MDDEVTAMFQVAKILEGLDEEARARVVRWAADKFGVDVGQSVDIDERAMGSTDETMRGAVDPDGVAAAPAGRESDDAPESAAESTASAGEDQAPPRRDPSKPLFMDTSFRMFSGKKELKKAKGDKK